MKKFKESQIIQDSLSLSPRLVYQIIRIEGEEELARPLRSLIWAGIAAGMLISFSVLGEAILRTHLPDTSSRYLIENFGYSFGSSSSGTGFSMPAVGSAHSMVSSLAGWLLSVHL